MMYHLPLLRAPGPRKASPKTKATGATGAAAAAGGPVPGSPGGSRCSFSRNWLLYVAAETLEVADRGSYVNRFGDEVDVSEALEAAKQGSRHYHYAHDFHPERMPAPKLKRDTRLFVVYGTSLQVAAQLRNLLGDIGILNSASARNPGEKFVRGTVSQEDCICRASLLHPCLVQFRDLPDHYVSVNAAIPEGRSSACAIFAPRVPVYRADSERCPVLDAPQLCSILSMPAPNAFEVVLQLERHGGAHEAAPSASKALPPEALADLPASPRSSTAVVDDLRLHSDAQFQQLLDRMYDRIFRALSIFLENGVRHLVLCAFGCGVHGNDPEMVAEIFKRLLESHWFRRRFETVVFAIQPSRTYNFDAFVRVFPVARNAIPEDWGAPPPGAA